MLKLVNGEHFNNIDLSLADTYFLVRVLCAHKDYLKHLAEMTNDDPDKLFNCGVTRINSIISKLNGDTDESTEK